MKIKYRLSILTSKKINFEFFYRLVVKGVDLSSLLTNPSAISDTKRCKQEEKKLICHLLSKMEIIVRREYHFLYYVNTWLIVAFHDQYTVHNKGATEVCSQIHYGDPKMAGRSSPKMKDHYMLLKTQQKHS